jgi:phage gp37-like protein
LAASGVTSGTYTKVTVDTKGRVTTGATATASDIGAAGLDSPAFTGTPTATTAAAGTDTTQIATTAFTLANRGDRYLTTSTSSHSLTIGSKTFVVQSGLSYTPTQDVTIVYDASRHMHAIVTSYSGTTLVVNVDTVEGSGGPFTAWTINVGGLLTAQGALLEVNNLSDVSNPATALTNIGGVPTSRTISAGTGLTGGGDLTANRTLAVSYGSAAGTACEGNDARLSDARTPSSTLAHKSSHATSGTDALAPSDIGAIFQWSVFEEAISASPTTLATGRARRITISTTLSTDTEVLLPTTGNQDADLFQLIRSGSIANGRILVKTSAGGSTLADLGTKDNEGRSFTFRWQTGGSFWAIVPVDAHGADKVTSGTLDVARLPVGTGSTQVAAGNHTHVVADVTGAAASGSITASGLTQATARILGRTSASSGSIEEITIGSGLSLSAGELSATSSGGISAVGASTADVLSVSGSDLVADDGGLINSANPAVVWDDVAGKLVYANPLARPSGAGSMFVGLAPSTTALGTDAINIQNVRGAATRVASGQSSINIGSGTASAQNTIVIGNVSTASTRGSIVIDGEGGALANGGNNAIAIGSVAQSTGGNGTIAIGQSATASAAASMAIGGFDAQATGAWSVAIGRESRASLRAQFGTRPFSSVYWGGQTTNNTATILTLDATGTATDRFTIAASTALAVDILLVARRSDTADKWLVARRFLGIRRDGSNNTALIGTVQTLGTDQSAGSPTWTFALTADDTNEALQLEVTGAASETIQWRATAFYRVA